MSLKDTEFTLILEDTSKRIDGNIVWKEDEDHSPARQFQAEVKSEKGWPLFIKGHYNPLINSLSYALIMRPVSRIYGLDLGKDHRNPQGEQVGEKHKHKWSEKYRDKVAYVPSDITASVSNPAAVWKQFCTEARIQHDGVLLSPLIQEEMFQ